MPKKTSRNNRINKTSSKSFSDYLSQIKWGESYTSLFLGAVVVVVALVLLFSFVKSTNLTKNTGSSSTSTSNQMPKTYTVKQGEDLWSISEKIYGSGYNWVDLAKANNLTNPDVLFVGTKLTVPNVLPKKPIISQMKVSNPITSNTYTVVKGDYLWAISLRAYGDGYKWVEIAKANNLTNPNLIFSGNVLKLPR